MHRRLLVLACAILLTATGCAGSVGPFPADPDAASQSGAGSLPQFAPCTPAEATDTFLQPRVLTDADLSTDPDHFGILEPGRLEVRSVGPLELVNGYLGAGNGFIAAGGGVPGVAVADHTVTATVTTSTLYAGDAERGLAFVEFHLSDEPPVSWTETDELGFGTDGGDGGFVATGGATAPSLSDDPGIDAQVEASDRFIAAAFDEDGRSRSCVERTTAGRVDGFMVLTQGDGWFPTFVGRDAAGAVVSVVWYAITVPWAFAGLPGPAPEAFRDDPPVG